jgi:hypothetical protein
MESGRLEQDSPEMILKKAHKEINIKGSTWKDIIAKKSQNGEDYNCNKEKNIVN